MKTKKEAKQTKPNEAKKSGQPAAAAASPIKYGRPGTIKNVIIDLFQENPGVANEEMVAAVKAQFPESAFDGKHASWYRMQAKKGNLTGTPIAIPKKAPIQIPKKAKTKKTAA